MTTPNSQRITALYERLSKDDDVVGDSNSILNQKKILEDYAAKNGFLHCAHYTDDGYSGGSFNRPAWKKLIRDVEAGIVQTVIAKDMSRVGRNYLETGYYTEVFFRRHEVRFIAITNGVDSEDHSSEEFAPFLNIMNEWYLRDCSRKMRTTYQLKSKAGKLFTNMMLLSSVILSSRRSRFRLSVNVRPYRIRSTRLLKVSRRQRASIQIVLPSSSLKRPNVGWKHGSKS